MPVLWIRPVSSINGKVNEALANIVYPFTGGGKTMYIHMGWLDKPEPTIDPPAPPQSEAVSRKEIFYYRSLALGLGHQEGAPWPICFIARNQCKKL